MIIETPVRGSCGNTTCDPTSFKIAHRETDEVREVSKAKLTKLWKMNKYHAIQIVKDGGMKAGAQWPLNAQDIKEYNTEKVKRGLTH